MNTAFQSPLIIGPFAAPSLSVSAHRPTGLSMARVTRGGRPADVWAVAEPLVSNESTEAVKDRIKSNVMDTYVRFPLAISHGKGALLYDLDGNEYIDCVAGIATCTLGHADARVVKAVSEQIARTAHVSNLYYIPEQANLARWLVDRSPADKVFFCNSGAEANEAAIKLARKRWHLKHGSTAENQGTPVIVTAMQSFHGRTLATLTATGQPKYRANWWPLVPGFEYVRYNDAEHLGEICNNLGDNLAGVLLEVLQGEGGVRPATNEFMKAAREACDAVGALLICDEVQVGMGRTGTLWGFEQSGVTPDVFTLAKGLGGGVPIGAMLAQEHCNVFNPGDHASTFGGNPLATAAGAAVAEALDGGVLDNVRERGDQMYSGLQNIATRYPKVIKEIRGRGLILGVELEGIAAGDIVKHAMGNGLLLVVAGPSVVRFVPPLVITKEQVDVVLKKFEQAINGNC